MKAILPCSLVGITLSLVVFVAYAGDDSTVAAEKKKLEGSWVGGIKYDGTDTFYIKIDELVIKDGNITAKDPPNKSRQFGTGTFTLNPSASPKTLDATGTSGKYAGKTYLGIYKLDGDTLEWCVAPPGKERPKEFFTQCPKQDNLIFKRQNAVATKESVPEN